MLNRFNINHLKAAILAVLPEFDLSSLVANPSAFKEQFDTQTADAVKAAKADAVTELTNETTEAFGIELQEGEALPAALESHFSTVQASEKSLQSVCEALTETGIEITADAIPEKSELVALIDAKRSKAAASQLANHGHDKPLDLTPTKPGGDTKGTETPDDALMEEYLSMEPGPERALFRSKNFAALMKSQGLN